MLGPTKDQTMDIQKKISAWIDPAYGYATNPIQDILCLITRLSLTWGLCQDPGGFRQKSAYL